MATASSNVIGPISIPDPVTPPVPGSGAGTLTGCGLPGVRFYESYRWSFIVTNLNLETITSLDRIASNRQVTKTLNDATQISLSVPSDNIRVYLAAADGDPKVDEGARCLLGFRREGIDDWQIRAAGIIMQAHDSLDGDVMRTEISAWDPWHYLDFIPIQRPINLVGNFTGIVYMTPDQTPKNQAENVIEVDTIRDVIRSQLHLAQLNLGHDIFIDSGQTTFYGGFMDDAPLPHPFNVQLGDSIGQMLRSIADLGYGDIVLTPIYDPVARPGILCELSFFADPKYGGTGAGTDNFTSIFSWGRMPRTLTSLDRVQDGTQRSNQLRFVPSRGGVPVSLVTDTTSIAKYRTYQQMSYFPTQGGYNERILDLATAQLVLRTNGVETITVSPTPDLAKTPLLDYDIGDTVSIYAGTNFRKSVQDRYRILQIPITISDESLETVDSLTIKKVIPQTYVGPFTGPDIALSRIGSDAAQIRTQRTPMNSLPGP